MCAAIHLRRNVLHQGRAMINAISSSVSTPYPVTGTAELATLQKELVSYEKQLSVAQTNPVSGGPVQTQLLAAQVSLLTAQIVSLSGVTPVSFAPAGGQIQTPSSLPAVTGSSNSGTAAPVATVTVAAVQQPVAVAAPAPSAVNDEHAALSQAQATLSAIFEKVSVQGATAPPAAPSLNSTVSSAAARAQTASQASIALPSTSQSAANVPVGSNINVTV
jgi:hypothetical protein